MMVSLIYKNHCLAWSFGNEVPQLILWRDAGRGIVRVADVNQTFICRREHLWQIVAEAAGERNFHNLSAVDARMIENGLERRIGSDHFSATGRECCQGSTTARFRQR